MFSDDKAGTVSKQGSSSDQPPDLKAAHTPSPAGVNRRTAVLFSKKGTRNPPPPTPSKSPPPSSSDQTPTTQPPARKPGRPPKNKNQQQEQLHVDTAEPRSPESSHSRGPASPVGPFSAGRKRSSSLGHTSESEMRPSPPKRAMSLVESSLSPIGDGPDGPDLAQRDSFKTYRIRNIRSSSESDTTSELSSGDESESSTASSSNQSPSGRSPSPRCSWWLGSFVFVWTSYVVVFTDRMYLFCRPAVSHLCGKQCVHVHSQEWFCGHFMNLYWEWNPDIAQFALSHMHLVIYYCKTIVKL